MGFRPKYWAKCIPSIKNLELIWKEPSISSCKMHIFKKGIMYGLWHFLFPKQLTSNLTFQKLPFQNLSERMIVRHWEFAFIWFMLHMLLTHGMCQKREARSWQVKVNLSCVDQRLSYLNHHLCLLGCTLAGSKDPASCTQNNNTATWNVGIFTFGPRCPFFTNFAVPSCLHIWLFALIIKILSVV